MPPDEYSKCYQSGSVSSFTRYTPKFPDEKQMSYCFNSWVKLKKLKHNTAKQSNTVTSQLSGYDDDGAKKISPLSRSIDALIYPGRI